MWHTGLLAGDQKEKSVLSYLRWNWGCPQQREQAEREHFRNPERPTAERDLIKGRTKVLIISITISARRLMTLLTSVLIACPNYIRKNKNLLKISPLALDLYWSPFLSSKKVLTQQGFRKKPKKKTEGWKEHWSIRIARVKELEAIQSTSRGGARKKPQQKK